MAESPARELFTDPDFLEAFERMTRQLIEEVVDNANPHPSGTDSHDRLRDLITRIAREEIARAGSSATGAATFTGLSGDLDRAGAPIKTEPAVPASEPRSGDV